MSDTSGVLKGYQSGSPGPTGATGPGGSTTPSDVQQSIDDEERRKTAEAQAQAAAAAQAKAIADEKARHDNAYEYGGYQGGAAGQAGYFNSLAQGAQGRWGEQINTRNTNEDRANAFSARGQQLSMADLMAARARGQVPSIAQMQADRQMQQMTAAQSSAAASARGPAALALAQQGAAANTAAGQSSISNMAQINAANERLQAEQAAMGAYSGIRQGDYQGQGIDAQQALAQAQINAQQRAQNDAYSQGMFGNAIGINEFQSNAQQNRNAADAGLYFNQQNLLNQQHSSGRADLQTGLQVGGTALGAVGTGVAVGTASGLLGGGGPKGSDPSDVGGPNYGATPGNNGQIVDTTDAGQQRNPGANPGDPGNSGDPNDPNHYARGGPMPAGRPAVVGEEGPELVVPRSYMAQRLSGCREGGGPVQTGKPYLVGERGPEVIVPKQSGQVLTADQTRAVQEAAARAGGDVAAGVRQPQSFSRGASTVDTSLTPEEEAAYQDWKKQYAPRDSGGDYDLRGAFKGGIKPDAETGHWPDTYKKPNHPTFSDESQYAKQGTPGHWVGETFYPAGTAPPSAVAAQADPLSRTLVDISHTPPVPGAPPSMMDPAKTIQGVGQAVGMSAEGYGRAYDRAQPYIVAAKRRVESGIDEGATRIGNAGRAIAGHPLAASTAPPATNEMRDPGVALGEAIAQRVPHVSENERIQNEARLAQARNSAERFARPKAMWMEQNVPGARLAADAFRRQEAPAPRAPIQMQREFSNEAEKQAYLARRSFMAQRLRGSQ